MTTARMPMSVASRRGISGVAAQAESEPLVLTSHGRAVAFLESGAHREQSALLLRNAAAAVIDAAADLVADGKTHVIAPTVATTPVSAQSRARAYPPL